MPRMPPPSARTDYLIVGAGPTGLGAAWRLAELGQHDWCLCEAGTAFGGLAGSTLDADGFTWDYGGHVRHSHYDYFDDLMDGLLGPDGWISHARESWIWVSGRFVPYPFQLNLHRLPDEAREDCVAGLRAAQSARRHTPPAHFGDWIDATFGAGIGRLFMHPYNRKTWAHPLEEMDWRWIGDRVALPDVERVIDNSARGLDDTSWGPNSRFLFPRRGGTGAIWTALGERLRRSHPASVRLDHRLVAVDAANHVACFANGERIGYRRLLTTMPLDEFAALTDERERLASPSARLRYSSTNVIGVALTGTAPAELARKCWMYFPEDDCPFYRVTVFSNYAPSNVPDPARFWSLLAEVSESSWLTRDSRSLVEDTVQGLLNTGLIASRAQVHHVWQRRLEHGYPVPTLGRDQALAEMLTILASHDIFSRGRFGAWKYEVSNQDHSLAQGVEFIDRCLTGAPERTLDDPQGVNGRGHARS